MAALAASKPSVRTARVVARNGAARRADAEGRTAVDGRLAGLIVRHRHEAGHRRGVALVIADGDVNVVDAAVAPAVTLLAEVHRRVAGDVDVVAGVPAARGRFRLI